MLPFFLTEKKWFFIKWPEKIFRTFYLAGCHNKQINYVEKIALGKFSSFFTTFPIS